MITVQFRDDIENITATDHLYQWDVCKILNIKGLNVGSPKVHFTTKGDETALVVQSELVDGDINAVIPDKLLQSGKAITAYIYVEAGVSKYTIKTITIPVIARVKPNDYVETNTQDVTVTQSYFDAMKERVNSLSNEISFERARLDKALKVLTGTIRTVMYPDYTARTTLFQSDVDGRFEISQDGYIQIIVGRNSAHEGENEHNYVNVSVNINGEYRFVVADSSTGTSFQQSSGLYPVRAGDTVATVVETDFTVVTCYFFPLLNSTGDEISIKDVVDFSVEEYMENNDTFAKQSVVDDHIQRTDDELRDINNAIENLRNNGTVGGDGSVDVAEIVEAVMDALPKYTGTVAYKGQVEVK